MDPLARLLDLGSKRVRVALGLMSGMSQDGLDLALVRLEGGPAERPSVRLLAHDTVPYDAALRARIREAVAGPTRAVTSLGPALARRWADDVLAFLARAGCEPEGVDVVGCHGQTLDHLPPRDGQPGATLQVGDAELLAERTGLLVVSDLRARDMAVGGHGAPLVPYADWVLEAREDGVVALQNLGSIGNVTVVTPALDDLLAFDTGPANALIDAFARHLTGDADAIDRDGRLSAAGAVDEAVLATLHERARSFLDQPPPRSAGYQDFGPTLAATVLEAHPGADGHDLVRTAVAFTAETVADAYRRHVTGRFGALATVRLSGGGARNPTLVAALAAALGALGLEVETLPEAWIDAKEAVAFAILADATVRGVPANVPGATGAERRVLLGRISLPGGGPADLPA